MSVELESKKRIDAIISACNEVTGSAATDLTSAVQSLTDGYGQGGGGDTFVEDGLVTKTLTEYTNSRITKLPSYSFSNWAADTLSLRFPNVTETATYLFMNAANIISVDFGEKVSFKQYDFYNNKKLTTLILRANEVCPLTTTGAFSGAPFNTNGTGGTVYVPQALIAEYQAATNWSSLYAAGTCHFAAIEGSEYE